MNIGIHYFFDCVFGETANLSNIRKKKIKEQREKELRIKFKDIVEDKKLSPIFRKLLRDQDAENLEIILYGNNSDLIDINDEIYQKYQFPSDKEILKQFNHLNQQYNYFKKDDEIAEEEFINLFKACKLIGDFVEKNNNDENNAVAYEHAYKALVLFLPHEDKGRQITPLLDFEKFLKKNSRHILEAPVHDTLVNVTLPNLNVNNIDLNAWQNILRKSGFRVLEYFSNATEIENVLGHPPQSFEQIKNADQQLQYARREEYPDLAKYCRQYKVPEKFFNRALEIEKDRKKSDKLPNPIINGEEVGYPGYYLVKLPIEDPRAYILGEISNCCQSIGKDGERCVIDGLTREHNGFYVLLKAKKHINKDHNPSPFINDKINDEDFVIVGQGYAWLSRLGNFVFDSWENLRPKKDDEVIVSLLREFAKKITSNPNSSIVQVNIGIGSAKTPAIFKKDVNTINSENPEEGYQYPDSSSQGLIYRDQEKLDARLNKILNVEIPALKSLKHSFFEFDLFGQGIALGLEPIGVTSFAQFVFEHLKFSTLPVLTSLRQLELFEYLFLDPQSSLPQLLENNKELAKKLKKEFKYYISHWETILFNLERTHLLSPENLNNILGIAENSFPNFTHLDEVLHLLTKNNLLTRETFGFLMESPEKLPLFSLILESLKDITSISLEDLKGIRDKIPHGQMEEFNNAIKFLAKQNLVNMENIQFLLTHPSSSKNSNIVEEIEILLHTSPIYENIAIIISELDKAKILSPRIFDRLSEHLEFSRELANAFHSLGSSQLLTEEIVYDLLEHAKHAEKISEGIKLLKESEKKRLLKSDDHYHLLLKYPENSWEISAILINLAKTKLLSPSNLDLLEQQWKKREEDEIWLCIFACTLPILISGGLLDQQTYEVFLDQPSKHMEKSAKAFVALKECNLLPEYSQWILSNPAFSENFIKTINHHKKSKIGFFEEGSLKDKLDKIIQEQEEKSQRKIISIRKK